MLQIPGNRSDNSFKISRSSSLLFPIVKDKNGNKTIKFIQNDKIATELDQLTHNELLDNFLLETLTVEEIQLHSEGLDS